MASVDRLISDGAAVVLASGSSHPPKLTPMYRLAVRLAEYLRSK
jgi:hypothetical protein